MTIDNARVNKLMRAFRYGERSDSLDRIDTRLNNGTYDDTEWHVALDGATLFGFSVEYKRNLVAGLEAGHTEYDAIRTAYEMTAVNNGMAV
jgi:hypothetical protein